MPVPGVIASSYNVPSGGGAGKAVSLGGSTNFFSRSASGLNNATSITWCCWVKQAVMTSYYAFILASDNSSSNYVQFGTDSGGKRFGMSSAVGGGNTSFDFTVGTWTFVAATFDISGALDYMYHAVAPATTVTGDYIFTLPTGWNDANTLRIGVSGFGGNGWNGSIAAVKIWTAALTQAEIEAELPKYAPVRTSNLWAAYKFDNGPQTTDDSGNGRTLTSNGSPGTDSSGPPAT